MGPLRLQAAAMGLLATALGLLAAALGLLAAALMPYVTRLMQDGAEAIAVMEQNAGTPPPSSMAAERYSLSQFGPESPSATALRAQLHTDFHHAVCVYEACSSPHLRH